MSKNFSGEITNKLFTMPTIRAYVPPASTHDYGTPPWVRVWDHLKKTRLKHYTIEEIAPHPDWTYDEICRQMHLQGVDTAINDFSLTPKRLRYVTFTQPFMTDEFAVYQAYDDPWAIRVLKLFCFQYLPVVLAILVFGLLLGALVYTLLKREGRHRTSSFVNTVAAVFGNFEFSHHFFLASGGKPRTTPLWLRSVIALILLVCSAFTMNFIYAFITTTLLTETHNEPLTPHTVRGLPIMAPKGESSASVMQQYGADVTEYTEDTAIIAQQLRTRDTHRGLALWYQSGYEYPELLQSDAKFGMDTNHFPVRWDNPTLLREMNLGILQLNDALRTREWCKNRPSRNINYCVL